MVDSFVGWLVGWAVGCIFDGYRRVDAGILLVGVQSFVHSGNWVDRSTDQSMTEAGRSSYLGRLDAEALHDVHPDVLVHVEHPRLLAPPLQQPLSFVVVVMAWWVGLKDPWQSSSSSMRTKRRAGADRSNACSRAPRPSLCCLCFDRHSPQRPCLLLMPPPPAAAARSGNFIPAIIHPIIPRRLCSCCPTHLIEGGGGGARAAREAEHRAQHGCRSWPVVGVAG